MIYCKKDMADAYLGINKNLDIALVHLKKTDLSTLTPGTWPVAGEDVFINCMDYETINPEETLFEEHARYADIHVVLSGRERLDLAYAGELEVVERDEAADYAGYRGQYRALCYLDPSVILIALPGEAHKVKLWADTAGSVRKAVYKIRMS